MTLDQLPRVLIYQKGMIPAGTAALEFTNNGKKSVTIDLLVGRDFAFYPDLAARPHPAQPP